MTPALWLCFAVAVASGVLLIRMLITDVDTDAPVIRGVLIALPVGLLMWAVLGFVALWVTR